MFKDDQKRCQMFFSMDLIYLIEEVAYLTTTGLNPDSPIFKLRIEFVVCSSVTSSII